MSSHKKGRNIIKVGDLVFDALYLNQFANFKKWYTPYGGKSRKNNCQVGYCYFN